MRESSRRQFAVWRVPSTVSAVIKANNAIIIQSSGTVSFISSLAAAPRRQDGFNT